jgi:hypothetical protein
MAGEGGHAEQVTRSETRESLLLWVGILAAPLAWTAQVIVAPDLAEILCYAGAAGSGRGVVYGMSLESFLLILTAVLAGVAVAGLVVSVRCRRELRARQDRTPARRATWMALAGILVSALFLIAIVVGFIPLYFLESCTTSP